MKDIRRIAIILNDRSFEYDIYTLVIAYFQGIRTQVFDPGQEMDEQPDLIVEADIQEDRICLRLSEPEISQSEGGCRTSPDSGIAENNAADYGDFRELEVPLRGSRSCMKNLIKRNLYEMLRDLCKRDLPWGDLTGIRPIKLAMQFLEEYDDDGSIEETISDELTEAEQKAARQMQSRYYVSPRKADLAVRIAGRERSILKNIDTQNGYSLYIGIPFCPSICLYCSFSSSPLGIWKDRVDEYLDALIKEMTACRGCFPGKTLHSVYIGGGTPTTLSPEQMDRLLRAVEENYDLSHVMEFTVEAGRPDSITREKLQVLRQHPVTRISVNPQTMNQKTLDLIGRRHTVEETISAYETARSLGFDNINMDLIVGLPGEGPEEIQTTMRMIESLDPDDVTVHALALKRAARLALHMDEYEKISFQASDRIMDMCEESCMRLGMSPYYLYRQKNMAGNFENVGYAKSKKAGLFNILIMEEVECILALGASGSTKIVYGDGRIERIENVKDIRNYLERIDEMIQRKERIMEHKII